MGLALHRVHFPAEPAGRAELYGIDRIDHTRADGGTKCRWLVVEGAIECVAKQSRGAAITTMAGPPGR